MYALKLILTLTYREEVLKHTPVIPFFTHTTHSHMITPSLNTPPHTCTTYNTLTHDHSLDQHIITHNLTPLVSMSVMK